MPSPGRAQNLLAGCIFDGLAFALLLTRVTELIMCLAAQKITDKKKGESNLFGEDD